jgi:hypothetical protein
VTNRDDIPDLLARADAFVMPSLIEGLPMALLEAMHARKAIIASIIAGIPEAIEIIAMGFSSRRAMSRHSRAPSDCCLRIPGGVKRSQRQLLVAQGENSLSR